MSRPHALAAAAFRVAVLLGALRVEMPGPAAAAECGPPRASLASITPWPAWDAGTLPLVVTWAGADPGSRYELQASWNGGEFTAVSAEPMAGESFALAVPMPATGRARTVQFRVRVAGPERSRWTIGEPVALTRMDEDATPLRYDGRWRTIHVAPALGSSRMETRNGRVRLTTLEPFGSTGALAWLATMGPDRGIAEVRVDDGPAVEVDLYAPVARNTVLAFASEPLESGVAHSLEITARGRCNPAATDSCVDLDGVVVLDHEPQPDRLSLGAELLGILDAATGGSSVRTRGANNPVVEIHDDFEPLDGQAPDPDPAASARRFSLEAGAIWASPNPSRMPSRLLFQTRRDEPVRLVVLDALGRAVRVLAEGTFAQGVQAATWDGTDSHGAHVAPGVYFISLRGTARNTTIPIVRLP